MSTQQDLKTHPNMPAFASSEAYGLTKREYFAAIIFQGIVANETITYQMKGRCRTSFSLAVIWADELIKELNEP